MRELAKSMIGLSWALSVRGMQQVLDLLEGDESDDDAGVQSALDDAASTTTAGLDGSLKRVFEAGDRVQRGIVDMVWEVCSSDVINPREVAKTSVRALERAATGFKDIVDDVVGKEAESQSAASAEEAASPA